MSSTIAPFGSWTSPITPAEFSKGNCKAICEVQVVNDTVFWVEQSILTGKRELFSKEFGSETTSAWAVGRSVQTSIHEYGGGALHVAQDGAVVFSTVEGLFTQKSLNEAVIQLANSSDKTFRFGDFSTSPTHVFAVNESHIKKGEDPENRLISVDVNTKNQIVVASGADFYAYPRLSPDGRKLVWMEWNHINMPWDETSIHVADVNNGEVSNARILRDGNGKQINYMQPEWKNNNELYLIHDATNFWNVYQVELDGPKEENVLPVDREIGYPLWNLGFRSYAFNDQVMVLNVDGQLMLRRGVTTSSIPTPGFTVFSHLTVSSSKNVLYVIASGPRRASTLIRIDLNDETFPLSIIRESRSAEEIDSLEVSVPEEIEFLSDGVNVTGFFYPPANSSFKAPPGELPPVVLLVHGGPTAPAQNNFDIKKQFFTSRGFAVFDVNYRGSTGFGTEFRNLLKRKWGVVDRDDVINGARALIEQGKVDSEKVCIKGSSAGGYVLLNCMIHSPLIKAAVSLYGVADLLALDEDTHKFEKSYNTVLIGKYPEEASVYQERSPINHVDKISVPVAFFHGKEDTVVPMTQSIQLYEKLRAKGIMTTIQLYEGEGHGFRGPEAVQQSTEGSYYFLAKALGITPSLESKLDIVNAV